VSNRDWTKEAQELLEKLGFVPPPGSGQVGGGEEVSPEQLAQMMGGAPPAGPSMMGAGMMPPMPEPSQAPAPGTVTLDVETLKELVQSKGEGAEKKPEKKQPADLATLAEKLDSLEQRLASLESMLVQALGLQSAGGGLPVSPSQQPTPQPAQAQTPIEAQRLPTSPGAFVQSPELSEAGGAPAKPQAESEEQKNLRKILDKLMPKK